MTITSVQVNPASGDSVASLYMAPDASGIPVGNVNTGEILKVVGNDNGYYQVAVKPPMDDNSFKGGSADTGTCLANPYTFLYDNPRKYKSLGRINNGTNLKILELDDDHPGMCKVRCVTTNGTRTGYMECRYVYRDSIGTPKEE